MDQTAQQSDEVPVPTARRVSVRTLPVALVMAAGTPLVLWVQMLDGTGRARSYWWLAALVPGVGPVQLRSALASAAKTGTVPQDPDVRITAGVIACRGVETQVAAAAIVVTMVLGSLAFPGISWFTALGAAGVLAFVTGLRTRRSRAYLRALRTADVNG